jgi:hypothetical protein
VTTKERLHQLVDELPEEGNLDPLADFLGDPFLRVLLTPPEGESALTLEEILRLLESERDVRAGRIHAFSSAADGIHWLHDQAGHPD